MTEPTLDAWREWNALVAEKVMGWRRCGEHFEDETGAVHTPDSFQPFTDMTAAWLVVNTMRVTHGFILELSQALLNSDEGEDWIATFAEIDGDREVTSVAGLFDAQPAPVAICTAALDAVGALPSSLPLSF